MANYRGYEVGDDEETAGKKDGVDAILADGEMNYTKGNWEVYKGHDGQFADEPYILSASSPADPQECNPPIARMIHVVGKTDTNAHLITAAPTMYEALKSILALLEEHEPNWYLRSHYNLMVKSLAKAEGKQNEVRK